MKYNLTLSLGLVFILIAVIRIVVPVTTVAIAGMSASALLLSLYDLLEELKLKKFLNSSLVGFLVVSFLIFPLVFYSKVEDEQIVASFVSVGDVATIGGLGLVLVTIGIRDSKSLFYFIRKSESKGQDRINPVFDINVVRSMATQEYRTMISINDLILEINKIDHLTIEYGLVHDGWSMFYDFLKDFSINGGPFYDLSLNKLFWEFASEFSEVSNIFGTISNPDTRRKVGIVKFWGNDVEVSAYNRLRGHEGFEEAINFLKRAKNKWNELKDSITGYYEVYGNR